MAFTEQIKIVIDLAADKATSSLKGLKQSMAEAEGASGKMKVAFGATGDFIKAHAAGAALALGTALVTGAGKAVGAFQDLSLAAAKMGEATGVGSENASRLMEVFGDVGVEAGKVEAALLKMNKVAGTTPEAFDAIGVELAKTSSGALDTNETLIRTIERLGEIDDEGKRAAAGTKVFGKSWAELSEVIKSGNVREALAAVSDAKVIDQEEVEKARDLRDSLDELKGAGEDLALQVGEALVPALADAALAMVDVIEAGKDAKGVVGGFLDTVAGNAKWLRDMALGENELADSIIEETKAQQTSTDARERSIKAMEAAEKRYAEHGRAIQSNAADYIVMQAGLKQAAEAAGMLDDMIGQLTDTVNAAISADLGYQKSVNSTEDALIELYGKVQDLNAAQGTDRPAALEEMERAELAATEAIVAQSAAAVKLWEDQVKAAGGTLSQADAAKIQRDELIKVASTMDPNSTLAQNLWGYIDMLGNIPGVVETTINISNSEALRRIAEVRGKLNEVGILADTYGMARTSSTQTGRGNASGGPTVPGFRSPVAERGLPELYQEGGRTFLIPGDQGGTVTPMSPAGAGGGFTWTGDVIVNGTVMTERDLVKAVIEGITDAQRRGTRLGFLP